MNDRFAKFLTRKHLEYQLELGRTVPAKEFAALLNVSPTTYSSWINGGYTPSLENLLLLERFFGYEVYDALGMPRPKAQISIVHLPKHVQEHLTAMLAVMESELQDVDPESVAGQKIVREIGERYGYTVPDPAQTT